MAQWNEPLISQRFLTFQSPPGVSTGLPARLLAHLRTLDDWSLTRLNPHTLARELAAPLPEVLDVLLYGVKAGAFDFHYNLLCPACGGLEHNHGSIDALPEDHFHCTSCDVTVKADLDDQVEVAFAVNPAVARLDLHDPTDPMYWRNRYYSPNYQIAPEILGHMMKQAQAVGFGAPGEDLSLSFHATPGEIRLIAMDNHKLGYLNVEGEARAGDVIVDLDLTNDGWSPETRTISPGPVTLLVHNRCGIEVGIAVVKPNREGMMALREKHPTNVLPWLTARDLLNTQTFRDLFKVQDLNPALRLRLRSLTLLFTDLKGSTEMYDRAGDFTAYRVVQEHFDALTEVVRRHGGAVIKTMGDAIMASFNEPTAGLAAALDMRLTIEAKAPEWKAQGHEVGLKIGLHEGSALAVNADDRLDYFGQNVNIAARVQGLSSSGEIWMTESLARASGVPEILKTAGQKTIRHQALLKGVANPVTVYQVTGRGPDPTSPATGRAKRKTSTPARRAKPKTAPKKTRKSPIPSKGTPRTKAASKARPKI